MNTTTSHEKGARIASRLAKTLGPRRYAMWFDHSAEFDYHDRDTTLRVAVPNRFVADWIGRHFQQALHDAAHEELGHAIDLDLQVEPDRFPAQAPEAPTAPASGPEAPQRPAPHTSPGAAPRPTRRRFRHRLEEFVVGPSNELAYAAARRLTDDDADAGHPLFLHGGCGLGKTHLLQGICRHVLESNPSASVLYTTGEQFTNDYITAVRTNKLDAFRRRIRKLDLLAVDDVHFIANKQATQQEFLHSFDQIELGGARVVLASDSHPKLIAQFSEALVSRCIRGLVVAIYPPDAQTRHRLVENLAQRRDLALEPAVVQAIANRTQGSVREIEGTLTKLHALVSLARQNGQANPGQPVGCSMLDALFQGQAGTTPPQPVRFETVLQAVSQRLGVSASQVLGRGRHRHVVLARSLAVHLTRQLTPMSYPEIASAMGRKNHSTIITAAQRIQKQLDNRESVSVPPANTSIPLADLVHDLHQRVQQA